MKQINKFTVKMFQTNCDFLNTLFNVKNPIEC
jgi:hypothetical protein